MHVFTKAQSSLARTLGSTFAPLKKQIFTTIFSLASYVSPEKPPSSAGDRKKWEAGVLLVPSVAQQTLEETSCTTIGEPPATEERARVDAFQTCSGQAPRSPLDPYFFSANSWCRHPDVWAARRSPEEGVASGTRLSGAEGASGGGASTPHPGAGEHLSV